jgi:hypothetical protein
MPREGRLGHRLILPAVILLMTLAGCVDSKDPVFGPDSRVLPLPSPAKFEAYERARPTDPWISRGRTVFVADQNLVVREVDDAGASRSSTYTFHPLGPQRFLVQADFGNLYAYGVLETRQGEAILFLLNCEKIDQQAFRAAGGTVVSGQPPGDRCSLDNVSDPVKLLRSIAAHPVGVEQRYVPVQ